MNQEKNIKIWQWSVALLMVANVALMAFLWLRPAGRQARHDGRRARDYVVKELQLTTAQIGQYETLIQDHQRQMRQLGDEGRILRQHLFENMHPGAAGSAAADSLAMLIGQNQKQIELATYNHFLHLRDICTPQQQQKLDNIIVEVTHMMNAPHPGPGGAGGRQGPTPGEDGPDNHRRGNGGDGTPPPPDDNR